MIVLTTVRLQLREYTVDDAPFIYRLMNSEGWLEFIGDRQIKSIADAKAYIIKHYLKSYAVNGFGAYIVESKVSGQPIGSCGLYKRDNLKHPDIGFAFLPEYCNQGFAFESAAALLDHARLNLKLDIFYGITLPTNQASIKLLKKLGLQVIDTTRLADENKDLLLFSSEA